MPMQMKMQLLVPPHFDARWRGHHQQLQHLPHAQTLMPNPASVESPPHLCSAVSSYHAHWYGEAGG
jgi:hypothetical protein